MRLGNHAGDSEATPTRKPWDGMTCVWSEERCANPAVGSLGEQGERTPRIPTVTPTVRRYPTLQTKTITAGALTRPPENQLLTRFFFHDLGPQAADVLLGLLDQLFNRVFQPEEP